MDHGARSHAKYSASNAHRFLRCPGQVSMAAQIPEVPDSEHSAEGTRAHELLQRSPLGDKPPADTPAEMVSAVQIVHDYLDNLYISRGPHLVVQVEQPFTFPQNVVPSEDAAGIADIMVMDHMEQEAWCIDFKYGAGTAVEAERNPQLLFNAVGRLWNQAVRRVNCVIIQPRIKHHPKGVVREWACTGVELAEFQIEVEQAIAQAEWVEHECPGGPTGGVVEYCEFLKPGSWCRWCPAETVCPAREKGALSVVFENNVPPARMLEGRSLPEPADLGLDRIAHILRNADMLTTWLKSVENYAKTQARAGVQIPGHKLVEAQARRQWHGEPTAIGEQLVALSGFELGEDDVTPRSLIGITEAESRLVEIARRSAPKGEKDAAAKRVKDAMAFLTLRQSSGNMVLVPDTDPRPAANRVASVFAGVSIPPP